MENWRKHLPPEQMTPEERQERVIELLVLASVRLAQEQKRDGFAAAPLKQEVASTFFPKRGPVPFGFSWSDGKIVVNDEELKWIRRIKELTQEGKSTEEIAERLNQEDQMSRRAGNWNRVTVWRILKLIRDQDPK